MASTLEARQLTEAHRLSQIRIGGSTIRQMLAAWGLLDPANLDGSSQNWLRVVLAIIGSSRGQSVNLASSYLAAFRALEIGAASYAPIAASPVAAEALVTSMTVTGLAAVKLAMARGDTLVNAMRLGQSMSAGAAMRHALNGGRETILESVRVDRSAFGWARATSGKPCHFCAMLASRGAVYVSERTASFQAHDSCACVPEPIYDPNADLPPGAERYRSLWDRSTVGHSGPAARNAFRQAYEASLL